MDGGDGTFEIDFKPVAFFLNENGKVFAAEHILYYEGALAGGSLVLNRRRDADNNHVWELEADLQQAPKEAHQLCIGIFLSKPENWHDKHLDTPFGHFNILLELFDKDRNFPIYRYRLSKDFPYIQNMEVGVFKRHIADNSWHWHNLAKDINLVAFSQRIGVNFT